MVIEAIGHAAKFRAAVEEVSFTGRVVYIGYAKEPVTYETRLFVQKELDISDQETPCRRISRGHSHARELVSGGRAVSLVVPMRKLRKPCGLERKSTSLKKIMMRLD